MESSLQVAKWNDVTINWKYLTAFQERRLNDPLHKLFILRETLRRYLKFMWKNWGNSHSKRGKITVNFCWLQCILELLKVKTFICQSRCIMTFMPCTQNNNSLKLEFIHNYKQECELFTMIVFRQFLPGRRKRSLILPYIWIRPIECPMKTKSFESLNLKMNTGVVWSRFIKHQTFFA